MVKLKNLLVSDEKLQSFTLTKNLQVLKLLGFRKFKLYINTIY